VTSVSVNILRHTVSLNVFCKPPLLRCGRIVRLSCDTEWDSAAPFVRLWCCCCLFWGINSVLLSQLSPQYFLEVFCGQFAHTAEVSFMLTVTRRMTIRAREVWRYVTICGDRRGAAERRNEVKFDGSSAVLFWRIVIYCVDMWTVKKESGWIEENLLQTVEQSNIQNKLVWKCMSNEICHCC
jgi:hypothetical protein